MGTHYVSFKWRNKPSLRGRKWYERSSADLVVRKGETRLVMVSAQVGEDPARDLCLYAADAERISEYILAVERRQEIQPTR